MNQTPFDKAEFKKAVIYNVKNVIPEDHRGGYSRSRCSRLCLWR